MKDAVFGSGCEWVRPVPVARPDAMRDHFFVGLTTAAVGVWMDEPMLRFELIRHRSSGG